MHFTSEYDTCHDTCRSTLEPFNWGVHFFFTDSFYHSSHLIFESLPLFELIKEESSSCQFSIFRYIHHTIKHDEITVHIRPGFNTSMPEHPSHATITIETMDPQTKEREIKRFRCEYDGCPRSYSTVGNLRTHMKTHKGELS